MNHSDTPILHQYCPICGKNSSFAYRPFCSKKCADIDLGRWLKGSYVIHTNEMPETENMPQNLSEEAEDISTFPAKNTTE